MLSVKTTQNVSDAYVTVKGSSLTGQMPVRGLRCIDWERAAWGRRQLILIPKLYKTCCDVPSLLMIVDRVTHMNKIWANSKKNKNVMGIDMENEISNNEGPPPKPVVVYIYFSIEGKEINKYCKIILISKASSR